MIKTFIFILYTISIFLLTINADNIEDYLRKQSGRISTSPANTRVPRGTVLMVVSAEIDNWFNRDGKGLGEYSGWYICDGRNGTPDLRGRFVVGRDAFNSASSYSNIGMTGGSDKVVITEDEMPHHSHAFEAETSISGDHSHDYNDVTYANGCDFIVPRYRGIRSGDPNNRACQIRRTTEVSGNHTHIISGETRTIGGNKPQENRPPYYVIAYIIYISV